MSSDGESGPMTVDDGSDSEAEVEDDVADPHEEMLDNTADAAIVQERFFAMWNAFVKKKWDFGDDDIPWACEEFSKVHKKAFHRCSELYFWWKTLMVKLLNYGLLSPDTMTKCNAMIQDGMDDPVNISSSNSIDKDVGDDGSNSKVM
ncbi:unnamed protein product [Thlaspi arvense]|uniref:Polycomb protein VEFS-Box domain-containing protein n=1 Tax=Thlaspi arvense TaxID=13288 RepID=A0AAU9T6I3_THLAR|nr:unnamed protein product [Thlaspi arvense]